LPAAILLGHTSSISGFSQPAGDRVERQKTSGDEYATQKRKVPATANNRKYAIRNQETA
jgi:hypothetical protein